MNPVYAYLNENKQIKFSAKTLKKKLKLKHSAVIYFCNKDSRIRRVNGLEVGSGKNLTSVFTLD